MNEITTKEYEVFNTIGIVTGVADGIVSVIGISDVSYVKQLIF